MSNRTRRPRGGKGGCEPRTRIDARQLGVWERSIAGRSQQAIALELGISQAAVSKILRRVRLQRSHELQESAERERAVLDDQLTYLFREAMAAWDRSKTESSRRRQQRIQRDGAEDGTSETTLAEAIVTTRDGDPRFLSQARAALAARCELLGLSPMGSRGAASDPDPSPDDPRDSLTKKLQTLSREEIITLKHSYDKTMMLPVAASEVFHRFTPDELRALADIREKVYREDGDHDEPGGE